MKYRIFVYLFVFFVLFAKAATAQQVSINEAIQAAINTIRYEYKGDGNRTVETVFTRTNHGDTLLYEVVFDDGNAVLLAGNKACVPILGIILFETVDTTSVNGVIDTTSMFSQNDMIPDGLKNLIVDYEKQINYCFRYNLAGYYSRIWQDLQTYDTIELRYGTEIGPLTETFWGQSESNDRWSWDRDPYAYNAFVTGTITGCPKCYAGCGATAIAQIMNVWKHPQEIPYRNIQLEWDNMPQSLLLRNNSNYSTEKNAIARLIQQCGKEMKMKYCAYEFYCLSTSYTDTTCIALNQFGYGDAIVKERDNYPNWISMLVQELDNSRPLFYRADENGYNGHAFVCDGYKSRPSLGGYKFHFNWGWNGRKNGWFVLDRLTPGYQFNYNHKAIFNIYPTYCFQNIIMECVKVFTSGTMKEYSTVNNFSNDNYGFFIYNGANLSIHAGEEILLTNGFYAASGSDFHAIIVPCSSAATSFSDYLSGGTADDNPIDTLPAPKLLHTEAAQFDDAALTVYPNPTDDLLHIELSGTEIATVALYDLQGRMVTGAHAGAPQRGTTATMNLRHIPAGVYVLRVTDADGKEYHRKIVRK